MPEYDEFVIFAYEGAAGMEWFLGCVVSVDVENKQMEVQFWRSENKNGPYTKYKAVWWSEKDQKEAHAVNPKHGWTPFLTTLELDEILISAVFVERRCICQRTIDRAWKLLASYKPRVSM